MKVYYKIINFTSESLLLTLLDFSKKYKLDQKENILLNCYWVSVLMSGRNSKDVIKYKKRNEEYAITEIKKYIDEEDQFEFFYLLHKKFGEYYLSLLGKCLFNLNRTVSGVKCYIQKITDYEFKIINEYHNQGHEDNKLIRYFYLKEFHNGRSLMYKDRKKCMFNNYSIDNFTKF